jgi:hypothetical protein
MLYSVSVYFRKEKVMARTTFQGLPDAEAFFAYQLQNPPPQPVEMWLKQQADVQEEYLLNHCRLHPLK